MLPTHHSCRVWLKLPYGFRDVDVDISILNDGGHIWRR